ncbi:Casparian strip membrane protein domain [Sesbania bispinosa]|nr:Casparian strip membrane protein domain [Sesbania bispinosa]
MKVKKTQYSKGRMINQDPRIRIEPGGGGLAIAWWNGGIARGVWHQRQLCSSIGANRLFLRFPSLHVLDVDFYGYTAFLLSGNSHGLVISWSITLLVVDAYSVFVKCLPHQRRIILIIILGDMVLSYLALAAACSTASVTDLLLDADESYCPAKLCGRYQLSASMAFLAWLMVEETSDRIRGEITLDSSTTTSHPDK